MWSVGRFELHDRGTEMLGDVAEATWRWANYCAVARPSLLFGGAT
jgi:hypothetical protein